MKKILIVDDKPEKYKALLNQIDRDINVQEDVVVSVCIKDALKHLESTHFEILILDMLLPEVPWGPEIPDGGVLLLEHLDQDPSLKLPNYIIGITAAAETIASVENVFESKPWVLLRTANGMAWEERLLSLIRHAFDSEAAQDANEYLTDICLITALKHPEFEALGRLIPLGDPELVDSATFVQKGSLVSGGKTLSVVAGCCLRMGSTESAILASKLIEKYRPRMVGLAGICAGFEGDVSYGDVIVASPCWDYTMSSKITRNPDGNLTITNAPDFINVEEELVARFENLSADKNFLKGIHDNWPSDKPRAVPDIRVGPSATGPAVIADKTVFDDLRTKHHRKTIGLEMEAYGVYCAARKATRPRPLVFSAKAVCDYADFLKDNRYQKYAAYTSASVVYEFLVRHGSELCKN